MQDLTKITREEMIKMAAETRKRVTNAVVPQEKLDKYPATVELLHVPTRVGPSDVYFSYKNKEEKTPLIINLHGGGFIRERTPSDDLFCRKLINSLNCKTLDIDYRLAPDYPFPAALHECYDVVKWAFGNSEQLGIIPSQIILTGHSAGGNLISGITILAKESGDFMPAFIVIEYPPMDLYTDPDEKPSGSKGIPSERARLYNLYYCDREQQKDYLVSPIFAGPELLSGFPKALVITAEEDSLCDEGEQFALNLARAGNEVTLKRFKGAGHGFTIYDMPGGEEAFELIVRFIKDNLAEINR